MDKVHKNNFTYMFQLSYKRSARNAWFVGVNRKAFCCSNHCWVSMLSTTKYYKREIHLITNQYLAKCSTDNPVYSRGYTTDLLPLRPCLQFEFFNIPI